MPELGRGAVRGREVAGKKLWEETRGEGSTQHPDQGFSVKDPSPGQGKGGCP